MLTSQEIRKSFIDFFIGKNHTFVPSSSVVPLDDPTLMFTNAGMNQFKDLFLGARKADYTRAANSQKCIRVSGKHNDLEEVGRDTYHHTFFEMLGNWSFGDYFKKEAIKWAWELLTQVYQLDKAVLWATVFGGDAGDNLPADEEAEQLWKTRTDINPDHVLRCGKKDNFWEMGDVGPCGPCSEIHIDLGPDRCDKQGAPGHTCRVNGDCARFIELWNLVFMQYNRDETAKLHKLPACHVDTGAGLERIVSVLQKKKSNYDTDLFMPIIHAVEKLSGKQYTSHLGNDTDNAFRVIADHIRTLTFSITDGALPSNDGRGYILRRILRRAARFGLLLDLNQPFLYKLVPTVVGVMGDSFPEIKQRAEHVATVIEAEETSFARTLSRGMEIFAADAAEVLQAGSSVLPGDKAFRLYDTYGFPLDLTQLLAQEKGLTVDVPVFDQLMAKQRELARSARKNVVYVGDALADQLPQTHDIDKYHTTHLTAKILGWVQDDQYLSSGSIPSDTTIGLVLDKTCAYAESGGQVGDQGAITSGDAVFNFDDTRHVGRATVHFGTLQKGNLSVNDQVIITIDPAREATRKNHTATHLLQWALREVLGDHVHQEGSLVCADYLRFDFTHPKALTRDEIHQIEQKVLEQIYLDMPVTFKVMPIDDARQLGAMALFSEKYGDHVRVLAIGAESPDRLEKAFSREFCGGTHVNNTGQIASFKIVREESIATGVRRITAMTGRALNDYYSERSAGIDELSALLKAAPDQIVTRVTALIDENKKLKKQLKQGSAGDLKSAVDALLDSAATIGDSAIVIGKFDNADPEAVRQQMDRIKKIKPSSATVLAIIGEENKVSLLAAVTDDLIKKGVKAGDIVKQIAPIVGGGGGGRPQMAQAGGKDASKTDQALQSALSFIQSILP